MKTKCFFCNRYSINIKFHIKRCKKYRQLSNDVFYNCILSFIRLERLKDCINKRLYTLTKNQNKLFKYIPSVVNNVDNLFFNSGWTFVGCQCTYISHVEILSNYIKKKFPSNEENIYLLSANKHNLKFFTIVDKYFTRIIFFYHKYTKRTNKVYGIFCFNINTIERYLNLAGIDLMFDIANGYMSLISLKKKIDNIYNE